MLGFIEVKEHARDNTGNRMKQTIEQRTILQKELAEILIDCKNTVPVLDIDEFKGHGGSAFHRIFVAASRTKTTVAAKRNKLKLATMRAGIHGATKRRVTAVDHLIDVFHFGIPRVKRIFDLFIIVGKDFL